jgi:signal transduction histidine kinase
MNYHVPLSRTELPVVKAVLDKKGIVYGLDNSRKDTIMLGIHDTGCRSDLPHITDPFFTTKRAIGATGQGLSVSGKIVAEHGRQLYFQSEVGKGTTVAQLLSGTRK